MHVLIASSSAFRRNLYQQTIEDLGHEVTVVHGGLECTQEVAQRCPDLLMLEAPLLWGGADGVLDVLHDCLEEHRTKVIVLTVGVGSIDWLQLSRFRVDEVLFRVPTAPELRRALGDGRASASTGRHKSAERPPPVAQKALD